MISCLCSRLKETTTRENYMKNGCKWRTVHYYLKFSSLSVMFSKNAKSFKYAKKVQSISVIINWHFVKERILKDNLHILFAHSL